jgi:dihydroneopterin aldolase
MALLAMHVSAVMLADLAEGFTLAEETAQFEAAWTRAATPIWLPAPMVLASDLPASWDLTSDSLAAWIAMRVGAARLILVKSCLLFEEPDCDAAKLAAEGIVDAGFAGMVRDRRVRWKIVSGVDGALRALGLA